MSDTSDASRLHCMCRLNRLDEMTGVVLMQGGTRPFENHEKSRSNESYVK